MVRGSPDHRRRAMPHFSMRAPACRTGRSTWRPIPIICSCLLPFPPSPVSRSPLRLGVWIRTSVCLFHSICQVPSNAMPAAFRLIRLAAARRPPPLQTIRSLIFCSAETPRLDSRSFRASQPLVLRCYSSPRPSFGLSSTVYTPSRPFLDSSAPLNHPRFVFPVESFPSL